MKGITLWQPWATAIALGAKRIETRSWSTRYRGPIAIHAARRPPEPLYDVIAWDGLRRLGWNDARDPRGAIVAVADLVDVLPTQHLHPEELERALGDFSAGRFGWVLDNVRPLREPLPYQGAQGLWEIPTAVRLELITS